MTIEAIRLTGLTIIVVVGSLFAFVTVRDFKAKRRHPSFVDVVIDDTDDEPCCEPDYSYDLGRYVHTGRACRGADYEYLKRERANG